MPKPLRARIRVDYDPRGAREAKRDLKDVSREGEQSSGRMSRAMKVAFAVVVTFITTRVIGALKRVSAQLLEFATDAEETASRFETTFGGARDELQGFIDDFANMAGLTETQAQEIFSTAGAIVQGMGASKEASAELSEEIVRLVGQ